MIGLLDLYPFFPLAKATQPITKAKAIINISKPLFSTKSIPNIGRLVNNKGNAIQCMAQSRDAVTPNLSQFIFLFVISKRTKL